MKKFLLPSFLLLALLLIAATNPATLPGARTLRGGAGAPSGNCNITRIRPDDRPTADVYENWTNGDIWSCVSSTVPTTTGTWLNTTRAYYDGNVLSATSASISGAITGPACDTATVSVPGAATTMAVVVTPNTDPGAGVFWKGKVTSTDTVTVYVCDDVNVTPTASTYNVRVIK